jgi:hypothetical protein
MVTLDSERWIRSPNCHFLGTEPKTPGAMNVTQANRFQL